jgi:hypothetical protein
MPTLQPSTFCTYEFAPAELLQAQILSPLQAMWIQSVIADVAEERFRLPFDPAKPLEYAQAEADLKGQVTILKYILECSKAAEAELRSPAQRSPQPD